MITSRLGRGLFSKQLLYNTVMPQRRVQISVIGAASEIGSNLSLLLKQNPKVRRLQLYDEDERLGGICMELAQLPGGPTLEEYRGDQLAPAIHSSHIILMVSRAPRRTGNTREEMIAANAPAIAQLCRAYVTTNPQAFLAISTNPLNSIIPFVSSLLYKYDSYNPLKILGITHIDSARSRTFVGQALHLNSRQLQVPVIGGHSDETIVPLFSNLTPTYYSLDPCQADMLTRLVRKAGTEVLIQKQGLESSTLAMAWSIYEFVDGLIDAVCGSEVLLNCYTANTHFGTKYFSGPTTVGCQGIVQTCCDFPMSDYETYQLNKAIPVINAEVSVGEEYVSYIEGSII